MITSMLEAKIVPTAKAVKRAGLWRSLKKSRFNNSPSAIRHFLEHGGRSVPQSTHLQCIVNSMFGAAQICMNRQHVAMQLSSTNATLQAKSAA